jgi:cold shock CspA family protein
MNENVVTHYMPLKYDKHTGRAVEKGIDVWLALEAYELAIYKRFDILVLIACDGDYVPLVRKINTVGSQVMLLSWDFKYEDENNNPRETRTSQSLLEEVSYYVPMQERIDSRTSSSDPLVNNLLIQPKEGSKPTRFATFNENGFEDVPSGLKESTILSVNKGFGFIEDRTINNVYFHFSSLENIDFNDLKPGMKVKYEQSQKDDKSYIASKVWVS